MAISSISSATSVIQQQQPQAVTPKAPQPSPSESDVATKVSTAQPSEQQAAQARRDERSSEQVQEPKPVVNAQGQKTGTIINTTA